MIHIKSPANMLIDTNPTLFLAGGITNCPVWQTDIIEYFKGTDLTIYNPRRDDFDITNNSVEEEQITWEHVYLKHSKNILFWFPKETVCPITLYELGRYINTDKNIFVGMHPDYVKRRTMEIQIELYRPEIKSVYSIKELANQILAMEM